MAEFVEQELEDFVPVLEQLQATQLLSSKEVNQLIKRCRRYDYRVHKIHKNPDDFIVYADYLKDLLALLKERRDSIGYDHKRDIIERSVQHKIAVLYRRLADRFKGRLDYWMQYVNFAKTYRMRTTCSRGYMHALQMHPHSIELRSSAALWEVRSNGSAENARHTLQLGLRMHPDSIDLWCALFEVEIIYVEKLKQRMDVLTGKKNKKQGEADLDSDDEVVPASEPEGREKDAVMQLKVAEVVLEHGLEAIRAQGKEEKVADLLLRLWRIAASHGDVAQRLEKRIREELKTLDEHTRWRTDIVMRQHKGENIMDVLGETKWNSATVEQRRFAIECLGREQDDALAASRLNDQLKELCRDEQATEEEIARYLSQRSDVEIAEIAVKRFPKRALFWSVLLTTEFTALSAKNGKKTAEAVVKLAQRIDAALSKCASDASTDDLVSLYKLAIDLAIEYDSKGVEKVFSSCIASAPSTAVRGAVKELRVEYLLALFDDGNLTVEQLQQHVRTIVADKPNTVEVYMHLADALLDRADKGKEFTLMLDECTQHATAEHAEDDDVWMARCEVLLASAPLKVGDVYRRAILSLKGEASERFIQRYTAMQQDSAKGRKRIQ